MFSSIIVAIKIIKLLNNSLIKISFIATYETNWFVGKQYMHPCKNMMFGRLRNMFWIKLHDPF